MKMKIKTILLIFILSFNFINTSYARRVLAPEKVQALTQNGTQKDYYIALRNLLAKYMPFNEASNFMRGFCINQRIYRQDSLQLQELCKKIRKTIFTMEDSRVDVKLIRYFIVSILPQIQLELYNYPQPEIYEKVLDILAEGARRFSSYPFEDAAAVFLEIISKNSSRSDKVGAFFAQLFNALNSQSFSSDADYGKLERIISDYNNSYFTHTKQKILKNTFDNVCASPEEAFIGMPEIELLIAGTLQRNDLFIQAYSTCALAQLCALEGIPQDVRRYIFDAAVGGVKNIPWDFCFDRNGDTPQEVNYVVVCIDFLADAEEVCREFGLDVDLAQDKDFVKIFKLLLLRGFNLESADRFLN